MPQFSARPSRRLLEISPSPPVAEPQQPPPAAASFTPQGQPAAAAPAPSSHPRQEAMPTPSEELPPEKNLALACDFLRLVSSQYLQSDPCHPLAFRLNRIIAWFPLDSLPLADNGTTMVPPPDSYKITALQNLAASNNWADLLETAEQQITQYLFWLDLQRHAATALERLGRDLARDGVVYETLLLIKRLPGPGKTELQRWHPLCRRRHPRLAQRTGERRTEWRRTEHGGSGRGCNGRVGQ